MAIVLISYFSKSGNTKKMADCIKEGLDSLGGVEGVQEGTITGLYRLEPLMRGLVTSVVGTEK